VNRVVEIALFTDEPERLTAFYETLLKTSPAERWPGGASFDFGGLKLLVHVREPEGAGAPANRDHFAIGVQDVDTAADRLRSKEVDVQGPEDYDWGRSAYLVDPDGRMLELHRPE
jgi:predicted enzyme related to lactoylglutathione lyase